MGEEIKTFDFFITKDLKFEEIEVKGGKDYYIEGYISTSDLDYGNDIVTDVCMDDMISQFESTEIKLDWEHEALKGDTKLEKTINRTINPIGKIIETKRDEKGIWIKAILNKSNERFKEIWASIKSGFLDGFSIGYYPQEKVYKKNVDGLMIRLLNKIKLINIALTGNPMNPNTTITNAFMKSLEREDKKLYKGQSVNTNMETKDFSKLEEEIKSLKEEVKSKDSEMDKLKTEKKSMEEEKTDKEKADEEAKDKETEEAEKKSKEELKSVIEGIKKENEELKSRMDKLEKTPMLKSLGADPVNVEQKSQKVSVLGGKVKEK
jgi:HK97 family phage prohead protease